MPVNEGQVMAMTTQRFSTTLVQAGDRYFIVLPFNPNEVWGTKPRHHIRGTVNGQMIRGPLGLDGTSYTLPLGAAWRRDTGLEPGVQVEVVLAPEGPQSDQLAADITAALAAEPEARAFFEGLATYYRTGYLKWIEGAKRPETRRARIEEMVSLLKAGRKQR